MSWPLSILAPYQRWYVYVGYSIAAVALVNWVTSPAMLDRTGVRLYSVPSQSMSDTIREGDHIVVDSRAYSSGHQPPAG